MDTLTQFGFGNLLYTFDITRQVSLRDNFRDLMPNTDRLPGADGGIDQFGNRVAPQEVGNVQVVFWVEADNPVNLRTKLDAVAAMGSYGRTLLYKQPLGGGSTRFCRARVNSIEMAQNVREMPHKRQRVQVSFQVSNPGWFSLGTYGALWGDGSTWGGGALWGGTPVDNTVTGSDNTFSVTPEGNAIIQPRVNLIVPAAKTATNVRVQRIVGGRVHDEIKYTGTLAAGDVLDVDCPRYRVKLNGVNGYSSAFDITNGFWFRLVGGEANSIRVRMDGAADQVTVRFKYLGRWWN